MAHSISLLALAAVSVQAPAATAQQFSPSVLLPGDATPAAAAGNQRDVRIARGADGYLAVWRDERIARTGTSAPDDFEQSDIYAARLDAGGALVDLVSFPITHAPWDQDQPDVAWNGENWLAVWRSTRQTASWRTDGIYAARVTPAGVVLDDPPILVEDSDDFDERFPAVASDGVGWVVVYSDSSGSYERVDAAYVSSAGQVTAKATVVPEGSAGNPSATQFHLAFASGRFLIAYDRGYSGPVALQLFDAALAPIGSELVLDPSGLRSALASDGVGFYVVWARAGVRGTPVAADGTVAQPGGLPVAPGIAGNETRPAVAWDGSQWVVVVNGFDAAVSASLFASHVAPSGALLPGSPFAVVPYARPVERPAAANGSGRAMLAWTDQHLYTGTLGTDPFDVFGAVVRADGTPGPVGALACSAPTQTRPALAGDPSAGYLAAFLSEESARSRIVAQRLDPAGQPLDAEPLQIAAGERDLVAVDVAWDGAEWLVAFERLVPIPVYPFVAGRIFARRVLPDGSVLDPTELDLVPGSRPAVSASNGVFLVVSRHNPPHEHNEFIRARRVRGADGALLDAPYLTVDSGSGFPDVIGFDDRWLVVWGGVSGAFVLADGTILPSFYAGSALGSSTLSRLSLARDGDVALLTWSNGMQLPIYADVYARRITSEGVGLDPVAGFPVSTAFNGQIGPAATFYGPGYLVSWTDWRLHPLIEPALGDVYAARVEGDGTVLDAQGLPVEADPFVPEGNAALAGGSGLALSAAAVLVDGAPYASLRISVRTLGELGAIPFCFGDGSGAACPCGNTGELGHGCANGTFAAGSRLSSAGSPSVANDSFVLQASGSTPGQPGLFFQGDNAVAGGDGSPFGDGLRCAGGNVLRLEVRVADGAGGASSTLRISAAAGLLPGDLRRYQWWYRDPASSPCGTGFNLSNGLELSWLP